MTKIVRGLVVSAILTASACSNNLEKAPPQQSADSSDATLKKTLSTYVVELLRRNPTTNTYLGGAGLDPSLKEGDGKLRGYSATALTEEGQWVNETAKALAGIKAGGLAAGGPGGRGGGR